MSLRYFLGILIGLGLIVLLIVLIVKALFGGSPAPAKRLDLVRYADTNAVAQLVLDAPINADQDHRTVRITIGQGQNEIDVLQGYEGNVIASKTYPNNGAAFGVFLQALNHLNFTSGDSDSSKRDERGFCPSGNRYIYSFSLGGADLMRYWSTSCGGQGTFNGGNPAGVRHLFERQIPDFGAMTSRIDGLRP